MARGGHVALILMLVVAAAASAPSARAGMLTPPERSMLAEMNHARLGHGLRPLEVGPRLQLAARAHASDMLRRDYFTHGPFLSRILSFGAAGPAFAENLAMGTGSRARASAIVSTWLASPGHRGNLLRPGFRRVGVAAPTGTFQGVPGVRMVTADFAGS